jgi:FAD binding domain/Berberine and berberine like
MGQAWASRTNNCGLVSKCRRRWVGHSDRQTRRIDPIAATALPRIAAAGSRHAFFDAFTSGAPLHTFPYVTLDKDVRQLRQSDVAALAAQISGGMLSPADDAYNDTRQVWNATVDRRPGPIARCRVTRDVQAAVRFAAAHRMLLSVRGGAHHIAGNAATDGSLMIDLSGMRTVSVNARTRTARVGPGALPADLNRESQAHGLATPPGIDCPTGYESERVSASYGANHPRLRAVKQRYDPGKLFRMNLNIAPLAT